MIPAATLTVLIAIFALEVAWLTDGLASFGRLPNTWVRVSGVCFGQLTHAAPSVLGSNGHMRTHAAQ
jgi:hypothetical protein